MSDMLDSIGVRFGRLGVGKIKMGSIEIDCPEPESLPRLEGFGDTLCVGDVFIEPREGVPPEEPYRLLSVFPEGDSFGILARHLFDGPMAERAWGPTSMLSNGQGWRRHFKKLTAEDVAQWFWSQPKLADGWHKLEHGSYGEVEVQNGRPVRVKRTLEPRSSGHNIKLVTERAGRATLTLIKVGPRYADPEKLIKEVISCETLPIPRV